jgi:hypothetical protein
MNVLTNQTRAIVASNLTTAVHVELAERARRGDNIGQGHPDASEEVFNTYLGLLVRLAEYDGSEHVTNAKE